MIKKLCFSSLYTLIVFCVISYLSVMYSLFQSVWNPSLKPVVNIGFPFNYYYQFWMTGSNSPNCGWVISCFLYDIIIVWVVTIVVYMRLKKASNS